MKLFRASIELVVIRDTFNPQSNEVYKGLDIEVLLRQAFGDAGLSENIKLYHNDLTCDITPKTPQDVDKIVRLNGRIYAVVKPMGFVNKAVNLFMRVTGVGWLLRQLTPEIPQIGVQSQPPSPNNALAGRGNKQRLGGRVPDIYGTVYSIPDLIAPTYNFYENHKEIEMSYLCVGRGRFNVTEALDDTTPISQVFGSSIMVFDPNDTLEDEPSFLFGSAFTPSEATWSRKAAKRYSAVNGQTLNAPDGYIRGKTVFRNPNIIEVSNVTNLTGRFQAGGTVLIEGASNLASANGIEDGEPEPTVITYSLNGQYEILTVTESTITLSNPATVNADWQTLADNVDFTVESELVTLSSEPEALWQGWFYTDLKDHDSAYVNIVAPNGLYEMGKNPDWAGLRIYGVIESEIVETNNTPVAGTLVSQAFTIAAPFSGNNWRGQSGGYDKTRSWSTNDKLRSSAAVTVSIVNPNFEAGKRLRFRISRTSNKVVGADNAAVDEVKIKDFYGTRNLTANDYPKGVTTIASKTRVTEGSLSIKERKLRLLVQKYVTDATSGLPKLSNRVDDILRDIATDPKIGGLQVTQFDVAQIKIEVDSVGSYFGTPKCAEFCYTFDDNNMSAEETMQVVSKACFGQLKRQGNKIMLDFERIVPASVAVFNSHNILPDTFSAPQSLGIANDYDGVKIEYTDPIDDAIITMSYPNDAITNPHEDKLIGVRSKEQAHMHMMRLYNKDQYAYKTCEFTAGDESNIVVRTNRITVADQLRAEVQQGSVESIETIGGDIVLHTTEPVSIEPLVPHTLFIQTVNNGVEAITVTARDDYSVKLARLPSGEISGGYDSVVQATYQIVAEQDIDRDAYLVSQKDPSEGMTNKLTCTNYDDRYYKNDSDYTNGLIT